MLLEQCPKGGPVSGGGQRWDLLSFGKDQLNLVVSAARDTGAKLALKSLKLDGIGNNCDGMWILS